MGTPVATKPPKLPWQEAHPILNRLGIFCMTQLGMIVLKSVEALTVLGLFFASIYVCWFLMFEPADNTTRIRMVSLVQTIDENWKAFLLLLVPLYYRTIRTFLEEIQEIAGAKRKPKGAQTVAPEANPTGTKP